MRNSAQCFVAAWMGGEFRGEWAQVYVWLSPFTIHLKLSQHCSSAIRQYKIKSFFFKKKMVQAVYVGVKRSRELREIANIHWIIEKPREFQEKHLLRLY